MTRTNVVSTTAQRRRSKYSVRRQSKSEYVVHPYRSILSLRNAPPSQYDRPHILPIADDATSTQLTETTRIRVCDTSILPFRNASVLQTWWTSRDLPVWCSHLCYYQEYENCLIWIGYDDLRNAPSNCAEGDFQEASSLSSAQFRNHRYTPTAFAANFSTLQLAKFISHLTGRRLRL